MADALGLAGFADSKEPDASEAGASEGELSAAEDVMDAMGSKDPKALVRTMKALLDLL